jgi:hypothetical protein
MDLHQCLPQTALIEGDIAGCGESVGRWGLKLEEPHQQSDKAALL